MSRQQGRRCPARTPATLKRRSSRAGSAPARETPAQWPPASWALGGARARPERVAHSRPVSLSGRAHLTSDATRWLTWPTTAGGAAHSCACHSGRSPLPAPSIPPIITPHSGGDPFPVGGCFRGPDVAVRVATGGDPGLRGTRSRVAGRRDNREPEASCCHPRDVICLGSRRRTVAHSSAPGAACACGPACRGGAQCGSPTRV